MIKLILLHFNRPTELANFINLYHIKQDDIQKIIEFAGGLWLYYWEDKR